MMKKRNREKARRILLPLLTVLFLLFSLPASAKEEKLLIPGGMAFGIRMQTQGVTVTGLCGIEGEKETRCPAKEAGIRAGDTILSANDLEVVCAEDVISAIAGSGGAPVKLSLRRGGKLFSVRLRPLRDRDGIYKGGLMIRDCTSGIGTLTFIEPGTGRFGGLGHGICEEDGRLLPLARGTVTGVTICGAEIGKAGAPGQLRGYFGPDTLGTLSSNTDRGVYGTLYGIPALSDPIPSASAEQVRPGPAVILCTVEGNVIEEFSIEIRSVDLTEGENRNFVLRVTDPALTEKTGGIVQGMSGSPILQDGRLVGAVTHVLVSDPKAGYGIFIGNMLSELGE